MALTRQQQLALLQSPYASMANQYSGGNATDIYLPQYQTPATPKPSTQKATTTPSAAPKSQPVMPTAGAGLTLNGVAFNPLTDTGQEAKFINPNPAAPGATLTIFGQPYKEYEASQGGTNYTGVNKETSGTTAPTTMPILGTGGDTLDDEYQKLLDAQKQKTLAALDAAYNEGKSSLTTTYNTNMTALDDARSGIRDTYYDKRNQAAARSDIGALNWAQQAAALGIAGNAAMQPALYRNAALQNALYSIDTAEAQDASALDRQQSLLTTNYNTGLTDLANTYTTNTALAGADADIAAIEAEIKALTDLANQRAQQNTQVRQSFFDTIGQYSNDFQAQINAVQNDGDPSNDWQLDYLRAARQDKINSQAQAEKAAAQQQATQTNQTTPTNQATPTQQPAQQGADYDGTAAQAVQYRMAGTPPAQIKTYLENAIAQGLITEAQAVQIGQQIGIFS